jgi:hypothetical protein
LLRILLLGELYVITSRLLGELYVITSRQLSA